VWLLTLLSGASHEAGVAERGDLDAPGSEKRAQPRQPAHGFARLQYLGDAGTTEEKVEVCDLSATGLGVTSRREFPVGLTVWLVDGNSKLSKCVVRHCTPEAGAYRVGLFQVFLERRESEREPIDQPAILRWDDPAAGRRQSEVRLRNVSEEGFQIESQVEIPADTAVYLDIHGWESVGLVCYCREYDGFFRIGLQMIREPRLSSPSS
jgi:hypothetical protein